MSGSVITRILAAVLALSLISGMCGANDQEAD